MINARALQPDELEAIVVFLGASSPPSQKRAPIFVGMEMIDALTSIPAQLKGTYSINESGRLVPLERGDGLDTIDFPAGVERGMLSAAGVEVVYTFEDGVPAVMVVGDDPPIVLVCSNLTDWALKDPNTLLEMIGALLEYLMPGTPIPAGFAAVALGGAAVLGSLKAALQRKKPLLSPPVGARRIARSDTLDHPVRAVLLSLLQDVGAASLSELSDELQIPRSTLSHHLGIMEREGLVTSEEILGERLYFLPGRRREAVVRAALRNPTRRSILTVLQEEGQQTIRSLADRLRVSTETVKRNVDILERLGLVITRRTRGRRIITLDGESPIYHLADAGQSRGR